MWIGKWPDIRGFLNYKVTDSVVACCPGWGVVEVVRLMLHLWEFMPPNWKQEQTIGCISARGKSFSIDRGVTPLKSVSKRHDRSVVQSKLTVFQHLRLGSINLTKLSIVKIMLPKRRCWNVEQTIGRVFSMHLSKPALDWVTNVLWNNIATSNLQAWVYNTQPNMRSWPGGWWSSDGRASHSKTCRTCPPLCSCLNRSVDRRRGNTRQRNVQWRQSRWTSHIP